MKKRIISLILILVMAIGFMPTISIADTATSGTCGENLTWTLNGTELTISGTGEMEYYGESSLPWGYEITSVTIQEGVTTISTGAFRYCRDLTSVIIADSVTSIGNYAFSDCQSLLSITIPDSVTKISSCAFLGCTNLTSLTLPGSLTYFSYDGFPNDVNVYYDGNRVQFVERFGYTNFFDEYDRGYKNINLYPTEKEYTFQVNNTSVIAKMNETTGELILTGVGAIPDNMMYRNFVSTGDPNKYYEYLKDFVKSIKIETGITSIGVYAFGYCEKLTSVNIPDNITIDYLAFDGCDNITDVYYGGNIYQYYSLNNRPNAKNVHCDVKEYSFPVGDNLTVTINENTGECKISGVGEMPDENQGFSSVISYFLYDLIKTVEIESGITRVGNCAFLSCENLSSVTIPDTVTSIGYLAFDHCKSLDSVIIPSGVKTIDWCAFSDCSSLALIEIPSSVTSIGRNTFLGCTSLEKVYITDLRKWFDIDFENQLSTPFTNGAKLYVNNEQVTNLVIPSDVTKINAYAFSGLNTITSVTIPASVTEIGEDAFANCTGVTDVYYGGTRNDFAQIAISEGNSRLAFANIHYTDTHTHSFTNACDTTCDCGYTRTVPAHVYDNAFDAKCNVCGAERTAPNTPTRTFTDVASNAWYKQFVDYAVAYGLFSGTSDTTFSPSADMTRAQFVQVLANIAGAKLDNNVNTGFSDAPAGKWFTGAVKWAVDNGVASGTGNGKFNPTGKIDRQQMCMMLVNYVENYKKTTLKEKVAYKTFADDKEIAGWAKTAVIKCFKAGLVSGTGNNMFSPKVVANRATGATIFTNFHKEYIA